MICNSLYVILEEGGALSLVLPLEWGSAPLFLLPILCGQIIAPVGLIFMDIEKIRKEVTALTDNLLKQECVELVAMEIKPMRAGLLLRFLIDRQGGIKLGECSRINRSIGGILEETDLFDGKYILEVSSPGADRDLATKTDFWLNLGRRVRLVLKEPVEGKLTYVGLIKSVKEQTIFLESESGLDVTIDIDNIERAKQEIKI